jgi:hypothetical protein
MLIFDGKPLWEAFISENENGNVLSNGGKANF